MLHLWLLPATVAAASSVVRPWEHFHSSPVAGAPPGVRRFSSSEHRRLPDGRGLHLSWEVDVDPTSILALDWEQQQRSGVALVDCGRERLTLHVPREHIARLQRWQFVTLSSHLHSCRHLAGRDLYHRVLRVEEQSSSGPLEKVTLATEELSKASQVFHHCSLSLTLMPPPVAGRRLLGGSHLSQSFTPKDRYDLPLHWKFAPPMPYDKSTNQSIPHFASETFRIHASKLNAELSAQFNYTSKKNKDGGSSHMEHFKGEIDFKLDIDATVMTQLKVEEPDTKGEPFVTVTDMLQPVALCQNTTFMVGPHPLTVLPQIDLMRLKVKRTGLLQGSFNMLLNSTIVGKLLVEADGNLGTHVKVNTTVIKSVIKPPVFFITDKNFELDASLETNISVHPFFKASVHPKLNISAALLPGQKCEFRPLDVGVNASLDFVLTVSMLGQLAQSIPSHGVQGLLSDLLPSQLCDKGFCKGVRPGCNLKKWSFAIPISMSFLTDRTVKKKDVPARLSDAVGYGLSLFPDEVKVVGSYLQNQSSEEQIASITRILGKPLDEAAHKLAKQFAQSQQQAPHARRLAGVGGDHEEADAFVVQLTNTRFEITDELLQGLLHYGAFRFYDGRESTRGPVRITSVALLHMEPHHQELWERAAHAAPAQRGATTLALATSTLVALMLVGLAGACVRSKRPHYRLVMAGEAA